MKNKSLFTKIVIGCVSVLIVAAMCFAFVGENSPRHTIAEDYPLHTKTRVDNGDGTYTIALNVTGDSGIESIYKSINIVLVMDVSGSMDDTVTLDAGSYILQSSIPSSGTIYGLVDGTYIQLTRGTGTTYTATTSDSGTLYGKVGGEYVLLTRISKQETVYTSTSNSSNTYGLVNGTYVPLTGSNYEYESSTSTSRTMYGYVNGEFVSLTRSGSSGSYTYTYNNQAYTGTRYSRSWHLFSTYYYYNNNGTPVEYDGTRYSASVSTVYSYTYNDNGVAKAYTGTRYTQGTGTVLTYTDASSNTVVYDGAVYTQSTSSTRTDKMTVAQQAAHTFIDNTLNLNGVDGRPDDTVELAIVQFSDRASDSSSVSSSVRLDQFYPSTDAAAADAFIDDLYADGGTNWEDALIKTNEMIGLFNDCVDGKPTDTTYVLFLTDGDPTFWVTYHAELDGDYDSSYGTYGSGYSSDDETVENSLLAAMPAAKTIVDRNNDGQDIQFFALGVFGTFENLNRLVAYAYTGSDDNTDPDGIYYGVKRYYSAVNPLDLTDEMNKLMEPALADVGVKKVIIKDGTTAKVELSTTGFANLLDIDTSSFKYYRSGSTYSTEGYGTEWTTAPAAVYDEATGNVTWDLTNWDGSGEESLLEDGVTYTVTFVCAPSQEAYDLVADLRNGVKNYDDLDANIRKYLTQSDTVDAEGKYTYDLATNTDATLTFDNTYTGVTNETVAYNTLLSVDTDSSLVTVQKQWVNDLDTRTVNSIGMRIKCDGTTYKEFVLNSENEWKGALEVAPGLLLVEGDAVTIWSEGHDYTIEEYKPDGSDVTEYHWNAKSETYHPMIVDGELKILIKTDAPAEMGTKTYYKDAQNKEYYAIEGNVYTESDSADSYFTLTNERRSNLNVVKHVTGMDIPEDTLFDFEITVTDANGDDLWFSVIDENSETFDPIEGIVTNATAGGDGYYYIASGSKLTIKLKAGWNVRFTNLPIGTTYSVTETAADNFEFDKVVVTKGNNVTADTTLYTSTESAAVSGSIDAANTLYTVDYTNKYLLRDVDITKNWSDNSDAFLKRPESITVNLYKGSVSKENLVDSALVSAPAAGGNTWTYSFEKVARYDAEGNEITYIVTEDEVTGYTSKLVKDAEGDYVISNTLNIKDVEYVGPTVTISKKADEEVTGNVTFTIKNASGVVIATKTVAVGGTVELQFPAEAGTYTITETSTLSSLLATKGDIGYITVALKAGSPTVEEVVEDKTTYYKNVYTYEATFAEGEDLIGASASFKDGVLTVNNLYNVIEKKTATIEFNDGNDVEGFRPDSVIIKIKGVADGKTAYEKSVTVKGTGDTWTFDFTNLPKYDEDGNEITYTLEETSALDYYTKSVDGFTISNDRTPETTTLSGKKIWVDAGDNDQLRPSSVQLVITGKAGDVTVYTRTITVEAGTAASDEWSWTITDAPKYRNATLVTYTVAESNVPSKYTASVSGLNVTNTHVVETINLTGKKLWEDLSDNDRIRPESATITVTGKAGNTTVYTKDVVVTGSGDSWTWTLNGVNKYYNGTEIVYTVSEGNVPTGYTATVNGMNITNTHTPETTMIQGVKIWKDLSDNDKIRPTSLDLLVTGTAGGRVVYTKTITITGDGDEWKWGLTGINKYYNGTVIVYTVSEPNVPDKYTSSIDGMTITNTYEPEMIDLSGKKIWIDESDNDRIRPSSIVITVTGTADEEIIFTENVTVSAPKTASDEWTWELTEVYKYYQGIEIVYSVSEPDAPEGYTASVDGMNITNTHTTETIDLIGNKKIWDDASDNDRIRPESVEILVTGTAAGKTVYTKTVVVSDEGDEWTWELKGVGKYYNGEEIVYSVSEPNVPEGYEAKVNGMNITNIHATETIDLSGKTTWDDEGDNDGIRPESFEIEIIGKVDGQEVYKKTVTVTGSGDEWTWNLDDVNKYYNGEEIEYTVTVPTDPEGYTSNVNGLDITNTHELETIDLGGNTTWDDDNNNDGGRPESYDIEVIGKVDGEEVYRKTITVTGEDWTWEDTDVNKYKDGKEIEYTVTVPDEPEGYTSVVDGMDITNTHESETIDLGGKAAWDDEGDNDGIRPESFEIEIIGKVDGKEVYKKTVTVTGNGDEWTWNLDDVNKYYNGEEIEYTVSVPGQPEGYTSNVDGLDITNTHEPETIDLGGKTTWDDEDDNDGIRPESYDIEVIGKVDGKEVYRKTITVTGEDWTWEDTDVNKYKDGKEIEYTVTVPDDPEGYTSVVDGKDIKNTHKLETVDLTGNKKIWDDAGDNDKIRPSSVEILVTGKVDGKTVYTKTVTVNAPSGAAANEWTWDLKGVNKYYKGAEIEYTVSEPNVTEGYVATVDGMNITNTHTTETIDLTGGKKIWDDAGDNDKIRPASVEILVTGTAAGKTVYSKTVVVTGSGDEWAWELKGVSKYYNGEEIVYTVSEPNVPQGYTVTVDGLNVTNTHATETIDLTGGKKIWADAGDNDKIRPESVEILVTGTAAGKTVYTKTVVVTGTGDEWAWELKGVNKYYNGEEIVYSVSEPNVPENYTATVDGLNITNTHTSETIDLIGNKKIWDDAGDNDKIRPESVEILVTGTAAGQTVYTKTVVVTGTGDEWTWELKGVNKYYNGEEIVYSVSEPNVPQGYTAAVDGMNITNAHATETIDLTDGKVFWDDDSNNDGIRPASIDIVITGTAAGKTVYTKTVTVTGTGDEWAWELKNVNKYYGGEEITYTVSEPNVPQGYESAIDGLNVTNTHASETVDLSGKKIWNDNDDNDKIRPASIKITVIGKAGNDTVYTKEITVEGQGNEWTFELEGLNKYYQGVEIVYSASEPDLPEGYTSLTDGLVVTNTHGNTKIDITVDTVWVDEDNKYLTRSESVTIRLYANGIEVDSVEVTAEDGWKWTFEDLDQFKEGEEITYTVSEDDVNGYTVEVEGYTVTDTLQRVPQTGSESLMALVSLMTVAFLGALVVAKRRQKD